MRIAIQRRLEKQVLKPISAAILPVLQLYFVGEKYYFIILFFT